MNLKDFNKRLKKEYEDTFEENGIELIEKTHRRIRIRFVLLAAFSAFICFLFIQHFSIGIYNNKVLRDEQQMLETEPNTLYKLESTEDFKQKLVKRSKSQKESILSIVFDGGLFSCGCTSDDKNLGSAAPESNGILNSYDTNVQTEGVDEADTAKCDGKYIYSILDGKPYVASLDETVFIKGDFYALQMYLYNDLIIYLCEEAVKICKIENDKLIKIYQLEVGEIIDTRLTNNMLYVVSRKDNVSGEDLTGYYYDGSRNANTIYSMTSLELNSFVEKKIEIISAYNAELYVSNNNIYLATNNSYHKFKKTNISIVNMELEEVGVIRADGHVLNQFSMDEYNGYLRVITTNTYNDDERLNALYIYSLESLELTGSITRGIGIGRQEIKSTTFNGDVCYAVTYLRQDPLYEIDCSDPTNPFIVSQYESPGYSSYLKTFEIDGSLYTVGTGYTDYRYVKISVYKKYDGGTVQIGKDLVIAEEDGYFVNDERVEYYYSDYYKAPYNLLSHKSLFVFNDSKYIYIGAMVSTNKYTIFKIDVTKILKPIEVYKEIDVVTDYESARGFLVEGKFYIPTKKGLNITEWN